MPDFIAEYGLTRTIYHGCATLLGVVLYSCLFALEDRPPPWWEGIVHSLAYVAFYFVFGFLIGLIPEDDKPKNVVSLTDLPAHRSHRHRRKDPAAHEPAGFDPLYGRRFKHSDGLELRRPQKSWLQKIRRLCAWPRFLGNWRAIFKAWRGGHGR